MYVTRGALIKHLAESGLGDFDIEDAINLVDILLEAFTTLEAMSWLFLGDQELGGTPLVMLEQGRSREVTAQARKMVFDVSTATA